MTQFSAAIAEQIWDMKYRFKEADGTPIDETVEDTWRRIAKALAAVEREEIRESIEQQFYDALSGFRFLPAGRITAGAGTDRAVTLFNCYVMGTVPDSISGIFEMLREAALTMQQGGGIGYDFSTIRPKGALVEGVAADASGPLTFMDCWDAMCKTIMSAGSRRGAMMGTMRCDHPDIEDFITAKSDASRFRMFNLSVLVTDDFMEAIKTDGMWDLKFNGRIYRQVNARDLWNKIIESTYKQAEPGVIFIDRINKANNLNYCETIAATNPCGEQPLPPYGACLLGSVNLPMLVKNAFEENAHLDLEELRAVVATAIRMMDNVVDASLFPLPQQQEEARNKRRLGLGVTGVADALAMCGYRYGSEEAAAVLENWLRLIDHEAYAASVELAEEKGAFPLFTAHFFLDKGTHASKLDEELKAEIRKHGIRNSHLTSIAPTGTISLYAGNVSSGIEPIFAYSYDRKVLQPNGLKTTETVCDYAVAEYKKRWELMNFFQIDEFDPEKHLPAYFVTAQELTPEEHVRMQAAAQRWVDSSISKTINCPEDISFEDFKSVYMLAWNTGCKGCTTYRPNEITGSVLSVTPKKEADPHKDALEKARDEYRANPGVAQALAWREVVMNRVDEKTGKSIRDLWNESEGEVAPLSAHFAEVFAAESRPETRNAAMTAPYGESPLPRPKVLDGRTYKIKFGADEHALYVTITDVEENGERRPFEVFINSKNMEHFAWTVALTRMISAVFRRPHDSSFVVEELKAVFDPKGGAWLDGKFVPSVLAAIGGVIEDHMTAIGYGLFRYHKGGIVEGPVKLRDDEVAIVARAPFFKTSINTCPKCHSNNMKTESGCATCLDCGHSKCG